MPGNMLDNILRCHPVHWQKGTGPAPKTFPKLQVEGELVSERPILPTEWEATQMWTTYNHKQTIEMASMMALRRSFWSSNISTKLRVLESFNHFPITEIQGTVFLRYRLVWLYYKVVMLMSPCRICIVIQLYAYAYRWIMRMHAYDHCKDLYIKTLEFYYQHDYVIAMDTDM